MEITKILLRDNGYALERVDEDFGIRNFAPDPYDCYYKGGIDLHEDGLVRWTCDDARIRINVAKRGMTVEEFNSLAQGMGMPHLALGHAPAATQAKLLEDIPITEDLVKGRGWTLKTSERWGRVYKHPENDMSIAFYDDLVVLDYHNCEGGGFHVAGHELSNTVYSTVAKIFCL